jgi:hypothetical protein
MRSGRGANVAAKAVYHELGRSGCRRAPIPPSVVRCRIPARRSNGSEPQDHPKRPPTAGTAES